MAIGDVLGDIIGDTLSTAAMALPFQPHTRNAYWSILQRSVLCLQLSHTVHLSQNALFSLYAVSPDTGIVIIRTHSRMNEFLTHKYY